MKIYLLLFFTFIFLLDIGCSFDLCPACSPETVGPTAELPGYMLGKGKLSLIALYSIKTHSTQTTNEHHSKIEQALVSFNYGLVDRLKIGLMYGFSSNKLSLQIDYLLLKEKNTRPNLILGIGSFRGIFSESHPYVIAMKNLQQYLKLPLKISAGIKHKGDDLLKPELQPVGNLIFRIYRSVHLMGIFEGQQIDLAIYGVLYNKFIFGMRMIELKTPAIGVVLRI